jgi:hypothetical protein
MIAATFRAGHLLRVRIQELDEQIHDVRTFPSPVTGVKKRSDPLGLNSDVDADTITTFRTECLRQLQDKRDVVQAELTELDAL